MPWKKDVDVRQNVLVFLILFVIFINMFEKKYLFNQNSIKIRCSRINIVLIYKTYIGFQYVTIWSFCM